jgi:Mg2+-importing ATPase
MVFFGPLSSIFDFLTFAVLIGVLHAHAAEFRTGWFVESLATQTLVIFVIRTRRHPFWRSRPSTPLLVATLVVPVVAVIIPYLPFGEALGFVHLPLAFYPILVVLVLAYLVLVEQAKTRFYRLHPVGAPVAEHRPKRVRRQHRRADRFSRREPLAQTKS